MFECQTCLRQAFRAVVSVHTPTPCHVSRRLLTGGRRLSADVVPPLAPEDRLASARFTVQRLASGPRKSSGRAEGQRLREGVRPSLDDLRRQGPSRPRPIEKTSTQQDTRTIQDGRPASSVTRNLQQELRYLKDPLELAKHVEYTLTRGDEDKAAALVRMSSRAIANIVSWNHLIKHQLQMGKHSRALETYNDLKKRGLKPDSYTYLILLDGLAASAASHPKALGRALSIYHALNGPNSSAAPSIMHTNATLKVCSQARDLDSIWDILSKLPDKGPHAANATTYSTLLNALRHCTAYSLNQESATSAADMEAAIVQGKNVWRNIIERWRAGDLRIDENLVCAMGRLLMNGSRPRDWDDIFSLMQQTMGIVRLVPRLGSVARPSANQSFREGAVKQDALFSSSDQSSQTHPSQGHPLHGRPNRPPAFALPGNNTLSLIIGACTKVGLKDVASDYWSLLTDSSSYGIRPDSENYHALLRLLRLTCSSADALMTVTQDMPRAGINTNAKTFRIALAACARAQRAEKATSDKLAWGHASELVEYMLEMLPESDPQALAVYLAIATERAETERGNVRQPRLLKASEPPPPPSAIADTPPAAVPLIRKHIVDGPSSGGGGTAQLAARERASATYAEALFLVEKALPRVRRILTFGPDSGAHNYSSASGSTSASVPTGRMSRLPVPFDKATYAAATRKLLDAVLTAYGRVLEMHALDAATLERFKRNRADLVKFAKTRESRGVLRPTAESVVA